MKEKSIDLMTGIVTFFNSALIYYAHNFFGFQLFILTNLANLLNSVGGGAKAYEDGK
jgi:hypothetical protein